MAAQSRQWYERNRLQAIEANARWREGLDVDRAREYAATAYRRRRLGRDDDSVAYATIVLADPCVYCGGRSEHIDHIDPRARGGSNEWANLTGACARCNGAKSDHPLLFALLRFKHGRPRLLAAA